MAIIDANRSEEDDEPDRLCRVARAFSKSMELAHKEGKTNLFNDGLYSLYDHKGILTATWWSENAHRLCHEFVNSAWDHEGEIDVCHVSINGTHLSGDAFMNDGLGIAHCGECGSFRKHFVNRRPR